MFAYDGAPNENAESLKISDSANLVIGKSNWMQDFCKSRNSFQTVANLGIALFSLKLTQKNLGQSLSLRRRLTE